MIEFHRQSWLKQTSKRALDNGKSSRINFLCRGKKTTYYAKCLNIWISMTAQSHVDLTFGCTKCCTVTPKWPRHRLLIQSDTKLSCLKISSLTWQWLSLLCAAKSRPWISSGHVPESSTWQWLQQKFFFFKYPTWPNNDPSVKSTSQKSLACDH